MLATQRLEKIKETLLANKIVDVTTLAELLNVSDVTVRKDLDKLAGENFLVKIHGGAVLIENDSGKMQDALNIQNYEAKVVIAKTAISMISANDSIFVGPGSTCYVMHSFLRNLHDVTVVTNNVSLALEVSDHVKKVFVLSGELQQVNGMFHNQTYNPVSSLDGLFVNKAFISCDGFDIQAGITYGNLLDYNSLKTIPQLCKQTYLMVDSGKFNKVDIYSIGTADSVHCVITDDCYDDRYQQFLFDNNIKFLLSHQLMVK